MKIRFWGTRGSIPAAMTARGMQGKLAQALIAANGHDVSTLPKAEAFLQLLQAAG